MNIFIHILYSAITSPLLKKKGEVLQQPAFPRAMWASFAVIIMPQIKKP